MFRSVAYWFGAICILYVLIFEMTSTASAQTPTPIPAPEISQPADAESETPVERFEQSATGSAFGTTALAQVAGDNALTHGTAHNESGSVVEAEIGIPSIKGAGRAHPTFAPTEPPCAEWGPLCVSMAVVDSSDEEDAATGSDGEPLADGAAAADGVEPMRSRVGAKAVKSPVRHQPAAGFLLQDPVNVDAVFQIFQDIQDAIDASLNTINSILDGSAELCVARYQCGAERVDDFISGRIDSEASGAYADYVTTVAIALDASSAGIREIESNPVLSAGEQSPVIASPTSATSITSLTGFLADKGLGESPEGLFAPVFQYCRIGEGGDIEIDDTVDDYLLPSFTWTPLADEFDIPAASNNIVDSITRTLQGQLPQMRTTPPMDTGVTIVKFPMWLWLNDPFLETSVSAISNLGTVRVQGHATFDHVTWTLGDHEIICTLEDMQPWNPNTSTNLDPASIPDCHHIFHQLATYTPTAAVTYRIEQDIARLDAPGYPWPAPNWQPHPTTPFVTISSTGPEITVREIVVVNVPQDNDS